MIPKVFVEFDVIPKTTINVLTLRILEPFPENLRPEIGKIFHSFRGMSVCEDVRGQAEEHVKHFLYEEVNQKRLCKGLDGWVWTPPPAPLPG